MSEDVNSSPIGNAPSEEVSQNSGIPPGKVPPLFRAIDWWAFGITTFLVLAGYLMTIAPNLTLEDSGELAVGSMYAGVPHPPGYPVWTIYTWLFTKFLPFGNIAWRVAVASAVAGALACGLIGLVVSRGSSMISEGIATFKNLERRNENAISLVAGVVAGLLMGFNGYMWSQSLIVEVYSLSVLSLMGVICCLLRWGYAPQQRRYLYWAFFLFGICLTNHMSLLVAAVGIQIAVAAREKRLGRDFFFVNSFIYLVLLLTKEPESKLSSAPLGFIFHVVGIGSILSCTWQVIQTHKLLTEWKSVLLSGAAFAMGAIFYFYMPLASMTNPPMNWGYPRTADGFMHAIKRQQYGEITPVNLPVVIKSMLTPWKDESRVAASRFMGQLGLYANGARQEFSPVLLLLVLLPLIFLPRMQDRERAWIIGLAAIWLCLSFLLLLLLNPGLDRQSVDLHRVFFTASHVVIAILIGYGVALLATALVTHYEKYRVITLIGGVVATGLALYNLSAIVSETFPEYSVYGGLNRTFQHGENLLPVASGLLLLVLTISFLVLIFFARQRTPLAPMLGLLLLFPVYSIVSHWQENEQRGHLFGYWFGHDMFTPPFEGKDGKPIYPEMARDAILFGGTDPGRFNPTYMIFCESFTPPKHKPNDPDFDRRDVYLITQNALADGTYLSYIRAHYNRSAQVDPPFFQEFFDKPGLRLLMPLWKGLDRMFLSLGDKIEKDRRVGSSLFEADHFQNSTSLQQKLASPNDPVSQFIAGELSAETRHLISGENTKAFARALAKDLNRIINTGPIYTADRFQEIKLSDHSSRFIKENPTNHTLVRWNRLLLEDAFPEIKKSNGGLYPDLEIHTPSPQDSMQTFDQYTREAHQRMQNKQLKPGEHVTVLDGKVRVSGIAAVMEINGLLTRVIFDKNPGHEFYVEESFPLEWMFPHLTPHGIIMKINRKPVPVITEEIVRKDHEFWRNYSTRLIGDWITYDTSIKEICDFAERLYLRHDYRGFTGDRKFIRDDNAQKAFSKLRSSIAGTYSWRLGFMGFNCPPQFRAAKNPEEFQRVARETEFALKQAFAFCPYSSEAVSRFVHFLANQQRIDDALLITKTCLKFDPENAAINNLVEQLKGIKARGHQPASPQTMNFQTAVSEITKMLQQGQSAQALHLLDQIVSHPAANAEAVMFAISMLAQIRDTPRLEVALTRMTQLNPNHPEAWYDLASLQLALGKNAEAAASLKTSLRLSNERLQRNPQARNLASEAAKNPRFAPLLESD